MRRLIWPGWAADLVLFNPETIDALPPEPATDHPGGVRRMVQYARQQAIAQGVSWRVEFQVMDALHTLEFPNASFDHLN